MQNTDKTAAPVPSLGGKAAQTSSGGMKFKKESGALGWEKNAWNAHDKLGETVNATMETYGEH